MSRLLILSRRNTQPLSCSSTGRCNWQTFWVVWSSYIWFTSLDHTGSICGKLNSSQRIGRLKVIQPLQVARSRPTKLGSMQWSASLASLASQTCGGWRLSVEFQVVKSLMTTSVLIAMKYRMISWLAGRKWLVQCQATLSISYPRPPSTTNMSSASLRIWMASYSSTLTTRMAQAKTSLHSRLGPALWPGSLQVSTMSLLNLMT